MAPFMSPD